MKTFVIGDIHGEYDKFINCLDHVKFGFRQRSINSIR